MILETAIAWREIQRQNFTHWDKLTSFLELDLLLSHTPSFPLNLPLRLAKKIVKNTLDDPILLQFLPQEAETKKSPLFLIDPVNDRAFRKAPKLLHKYTGRALLICTSACAMHCRYCFRQHFDYETSDKAFRQELQILRDDPSITEIILSGGDPLSLSNAHLKGLIENLDAIPHLKRLRFHSRFPMGIPERIDAEFLNMLESIRLQTVFVIHSNHATEWDEDIFDALKKIQKLGIPVLCQTVLLKRINDTAQALHDLFSLLADHGIIPYYLHQLDPVEGAMHFEVSEEKGLELMKEISRSLSGYAVPRYVREIPGAASKTQITSA